LETLEHLSVLHIIAPASFGGMESVVGILVAGQLRHGHSAHLAAVLPSKREPHAFVASLEAQGVPVDAIHIKNWDYRAERRLIRALCKQYGPHVVHTHGFRPDVIDGGIARSEGIATVSTCHGFVESSWRVRAYQWLQRKTLRKFDAVVAVSVGIADKLREAGVPVERVHLVFNAFAEDTDPLSRVEARRLLNLPERPVIGWVGRLSAEKGPDIAIDAFAQMRKTDALLLMLGEGRDESWLRERAAAAGVAERVIWRGALSNARRVFPAFDVFLLSSRTEGTPMALLEAMAAKVPIVATRVGGVPDIVDPSSACLIEDLDSLAVAKAIDEVLSQPESARARAERANERVMSQFAVEPWLTRYESIYRAALTSHRGRNRR